MTYKWNLKEENECIKKTQRFKFGLVNKFT